VTTRERGSLTSAGFALTLPFLESFQAVDSRKHNSRGIETVLPRRLVFNAAGPWLESLLEILPPGYGGGYSPPQGSPHAHSSTVQAPEAAERPAAEPQLEDTDNAEQQTEPHRR
jgi:hypothetical protein